MFYGINGGAFLRCLPELAEPCKRGMEKAPENLNVYMNMASYYAWLYRFLNIAISMFEYENLPEGIDVRMMELWLLTNGYCIFFKDDALKQDESNRAPEGYAVLQGVAYGQWDIYNIPKERRAYAPNGFQKELNEDNSTIIFSNQLRTPEIFILMLYAQRIAEIDRTIDVNVQNQKAPKVIRCDERQRLTWKNIAMQVDGNVYTIAADKNVDLKDLEVLDLTVPFVGEDLDRLKRRYISECMTFLGVEGVDTDKKERLIGQEVLRGMGDVEAARFTRLTPRQDAWKEINEKFGLDVKVKFKSGLYIQTGDSRQQLDPNTGMNTQLSTIENSTGYEGNE